MRFLRKPWGIAFGWLLQLLLIAGGFWEPSMFIVGVLFTAAWWYALFGGAKIDRENVARAKAQANGMPPTPRIRPERPRPSKLKLILFI